MLRLVAKKSSNGLGRATMLSSSQRRSATPMMATLTSHVNESRSSYNIGNGFRFHTPLSSSSFAPHENFSNNLIPLYPSSAVSSLSKNRRIGIRWFSSDQKKNSVSDSSSTTTSTPQEASTGNIGSPKVAHSDSLAEANTGKLKTLVGSVGKRVNEANMGDLMSVYSIVTLLVIVLVSPYVVRQMRNSDSTYTEDLDPEDPVADLAKIVRDEFMGSTTDSEGGILSSVGGGLDSIVSDLIKSPRIQSAVADLVTRVVSSPEFKKATTVLVKELWKDLVEDPTTLAQVIHLLQNVIQDESIKEAAIQLVMEIFNDKEVLDELVNLLEKLSQEKEVLTATQALLVESAHNALNDPEILDHSMEFATDVVGDDVVQQTAGEALYNTFSYAVRPTLSVVFSLIGASLIIVSISAFRNVYSSDKSMDDNLALAFYNSAELLGKIVSLPKHVLVAFKNLLVGIAMFPFRVLAASLSCLGLVGQATVDAVNRMIEWMGNLPFRFWNFLSSATSNASRSISASFQSKSHQLSSSISASFVGVFFRDLVELCAMTLTKVQETYTKSSVQFVKGASFADGLFKTISERALVSANHFIRVVINIQRSFDQAVVDGYDRLHKILAIYWYEIVSKTSSSTLFQIIQQHESLIKLRKLTIQGVSIGYTFSNQVLGEVTSALQNLLAALAAAVTSWDGNNKGSSSALI